MFRALDKNMRRMAWMSLVEIEWDNTRREKFRASLVGNPFVVDPAAEPPRIDWELPRPLARAM